MPRNPSASTEFNTLGRSGLVVSPFALGSMTFGTSRWGTADDVSSDIFNAYVDAGGNFVDTADVYAGGRSEKLLGEFIAARKLRHSLVLSTKFGFHGGEPGNTNGGGSGRKNMQRALEGSLRRLRTDCIDLYWLHAWDRLTPVEEVLQSLGDLVRAGKIRYFGFSNVPAWYAAKAAALASAHAVPGPVALQLEYSLVERSVEREHLPAARDAGLGFTPWSPLAAGFLSGKYRRDDAQVIGAGRLAGSNPFGNSKFTDDNWRILDALREVALQVDRPPAQVALVWTLAQTGVTSLILGARSVEQLNDNLAAGGLRLNAEQMRRLDACSAPAPATPYAIFADEVNRAIFGGASVRGWAG